jgi:hypothetical protein
MLLADATHGTCPHFGCFGVVPLMFMPTVANTATLSRDSRSHNSDASSQSCVRHTPTPCQTCRAFDTSDHAAGRQSCANFVVRRLIESGRVLMQFKGGITLILVGIDLGELIKQPYKNLPIRCVQSFERTQCIACTFQQLCHFVCPTGTHGTIETTVAILFTFVATNLFGERQPLLHSLHSFVSLSELQTCGNQAICATTTSELIAATRSFL